MSETTINALITAIGSLLGGFIGAYATIKAARIKEKSPQISNGTEPKSPLLGIVAGAVIGAVITLLVLAILGLIPVTGISATTPDSLAGNWSGTVKALDGSYSAEVNLSFQPTCGINKICGTFESSQNSCSGTLTLVDVDGDTFIFLENKTSGDNSCGNCYEHIQKLSGNSISFSCSQTEFSKDFQSTGILSKP